MNKKVAIESALISYSKTDKSYCLDMKLFPDNGVTTSMPLNAQLLRSLIRLFKQEGRIQKILHKMDGVK